MTNVSPEIEENEHINKRACRQDVGQREPLGPPFLNHKGGKGLGPDDANEGAQAKKAD